MPRHTKQIAPAAIVYCKANLKQVAFAALKPELSRSLLVGGGLRYILSRCEVVSTHGHGHDYLALAQLPIWRWGVAF
jgi:hypothetical protein